jgi:hypothetical protein
VPHQSLSLSLSLVMHYEYSLTDTHHGRLTYPGVLQGVLSEYVYIYLCCFSAPYSVLLDPRFRRAKQRIYLDAGHE